MQDLLNQLNDYLKNINIDYAICGGSAIDLFVGRKTRPHKDLDVAVFLEDRDKIVQYMLEMGWDIYEPCGSGYLHKITSVKDQMRIKTNIWCVKPSSSHYHFTDHGNNMYAVQQDGLEQEGLDFIEFLFNKREDGHFLYSRNNNIRKDMGKAVLLTETKIPYLAPEIVLLYKSTALYNYEYKQDFDVALIKMNSEDREWLKSSLVCIFPDGHEWISRIDALEYNK